MRRLAVVLVAGASLVVPVKEAGAAATGQASQASRPSVRMDFNGDGFGDLAIGVSYEDVGTIENAGAVEVIYGSASGLSATAKPDQFWTQNSPDVNDKAETDDFFGDALTAGDFNGDGFADLAIGVPFENISGGVVDAGAVEVIYGSAGGLSATHVPDQFWTQLDVIGSPDPGDNFGQALAAANFGSGSQADLAIGVPNDDTGTTSNPGGVNVIYGSASGLSATNNQLWNQDSGDIQDVAETDDRFGSSLAAANFGGGSQADLAIGVPLEDVGVSPNVRIDAGGVNVIYGSSSGLSDTATLDEFWTQDTFGVADAAETNDRFGFSLAAADFGGMAQSDLAIGVPFESLSTSSSEEGEVSVLYGGTHGLVDLSSTNQLWTQDIFGVEDVAEPHDQFGWALAAANFGGGSHADLAIAANFETLESAVGTKHGAVNVIYGSASGLSATATPDQFWSQDSPSVNDLAEDVDVFGRSLAAANFGGVGSQADLAIGIPFEFLPNAGGFEGAVEVIYGSASGLSATATPDQFWNQDSPGINNAAEFDDEFGIALAGIT